MNRTAIKALKRNIFGVDVRVVAPSPVARVDQQCQPACQPLLVTMVSLNSEHPMTPMLRTTAVSNKRAKMTRQSPDAATVSQCRHAAVAAVTACECELGSIGSFHTSEI
jgi:hypothetical protein